ncbi:MAG: sigma-E factor negative regulatory protein [Gammaproteobacteria bacterium]|nr:sigma-E factor negative regulatory protein [Gammaproteobacteria bacterium]
MTEKFNEKISAFMDGDLTAHEARQVIEEMKRSPVSRVCWGRYHLIGDALKNNLPSTIQHDLAARISQVIEAEPVLPITFAPRKKTTVISSFFKPLAGLAVAASVAAVAVVSFDMGGASSTAQVQTMAAAPPPVLAVNHPPAALVAAPLVVDEAEAQSRLENYLVNHSQYSTSVVVQPAVRMVGYAPNE